jgi:hypothetical protein
MGAILFYAILKYFPAQTAGFYIPDFFQSIAPVALYMHGWYLTSMNSMKISCPVERASEIT